MVTVLRTAKVPRAVLKSSALRRRKNNTMLIIAFVASAFAISTLFNPTDYSVSVSKELLFDSPMNAGNAWILLLEEGKKIMNIKQKTFAIIEVGMNSPDQCIAAAKNNFEAHCIEPSPVSFQKCQDGIQKRTTQDVQDRIRLYNVAASSTSGDVVDFSSSGSTGDMVGGEGSDMWFMTKKKSSPNTATFTEDSGNIVKVKTSKLDDLISENVLPTTDILVAKIDVQGFEPFVFEGLSESIQNHRIMFFLFEYWPKGMDFMMDVPFDGDDICKNSVKIVKKLLHAGYKLFALFPEVHPHSYSHSRPKKNPKWQKESASRDKKLKQVRNDRPLNDLMENCKWYYKLEREIFPQDDYYMGFWSDFVAVSPKAPQIHSFEY